MGKLPNVTEAEMKAANSAGEEVFFTLSDIVNRMEKNYCDDISKPIELARSFLALSRMASELSSKLLFKSAMQEDKAELTKLLAERAALEK